MFGRLSQRQWAQSFLLRLNVLVHPLRVDAAVVAQRPADRLALEELPSIKVRLDDIGEQGRVGAISGPDLRDDCGAP